MMWKMVFDAAIKLLVVALETFLLEQLLEFLVWFTRNFIFNAPEPANAKA